MGDEKDKPQSGGGEGEGAADAERPAASSKKEEATSKKEEAAAPSSKKEEAASKKEEAAAPSSKKEEAASKKEEAAAPSSKKEQATSKKEEAAASSRKEEATSKKEEAAASSKKEEAAEDDGDEPEKAGDTSKPSSPWPSARKAERPAVAAKEAKEDDGKQAWGAPLKRVDAAWTKLEARLCAFVLGAEILTLVIWISLKALSSSAAGGAGLVFRVLFGATVVGYAAHRLARKHERHEAIVFAAVVVGALLGKATGTAGSTYFSNLLGWTQNASALMFVGGVSDMAKRLTLWVALLGASIATGQGKHINVDVVMRFLSPKARLPVALIGWLAAAVMCVAGAWGFFDQVAVEDFQVQPSAPCPGDPSKACDTRPGAKMSRVAHDVSRDLFLLRRQMSLDLRSLPKVLRGAPYEKIMTGAEWNAWVDEASWDAHFPAEAVQQLKGPPEADAGWRMPALTNVPGADERVHKLLIHSLNLVFPFGLIAIALRFVLRSLLAVAGWVKIDPNAAHSDEDDVEPEKDAAAEGGAS